MDPPFINMCWWINDLILPELTVYRGQTYYFKVTNPGVERELTLTWSCRSRAETARRWAARTIILSTSPTTLTEDTAENWD